MNTETNPDLSADPTQPSDWSKTLEWVEKQAQESMRTRFATAELIAKEVQTTLTVLLAGVGGTAAYGAKIFESGPPQPLAIGSAFACGYLVLLSVLLVRRAMRFESFPALFQQPKNLLQPGYRLDELRGAELENLEERISEAAEINKTRAERLNRFRIAAAISPLVFVLVVGIATMGIKADKASVSTAVLCQADPSGSSPGAISLLCSSPVSK